MTNPKGGFCWSEEGKTDDNPNYSGFICLSVHQYPTNAVKTSSKVQQPLGI